MARDYIARDPKTGRPINQRRATKQVDIRSTLPPPGVWERIPRRDIVPLASGQVKMVEIPRSEGGGLAPIHGACLSALGYAVWAVFQKQANSWGLSAQESQFITAVTVAVVL